MTTVADTSEERRLSLLAKVERAKNDVRFLAENQYRILVEQKNELCPVRYNEAQIKLQNEIDGFKKEGHPVRLWILKARRAGLSTGVQINTYARVSTERNIKAIILANQKGPAINILNISRTIWKHQDPRFRPDIDRSLGNEPPMDRLVFKAINSGIYTATARSLDEYVSFGFKILHCSEVARFNNKTAYQLFGSVWATLGPAADTAFFGESTALGQGNFFHENCVIARDAMRRPREYGKFRLLFIPWPDMTLSYALPFQSDEERRRFSASLSEEEVSIMETFKQVGLEQLKWRRVILAGAPYNKMPEQFDQDFPISFDLAFIASGRTVFGTRTIQTLTSRLDQINPATGFRYRDPEFEGDIYWGDSRKDYGEREHAYGAVRRPMFLTPGEAQARGFRSNVNEGYFNNLRVYRLPRKGERLFIGADVGRGDASSDDGDYSTIVVVCKHELAKDEVLMTWRGHLNPVHFGELCAALGWQCFYYVDDGQTKMPLLAVEFNGPGTTVNYTIDHNRLYPRCFRFFHPGLHGSTPTNHIGWESNGKTKPLMVDIFTRLVQQDLIHIPDEDIINEMSTYRKLSDFGDVSDYGGVGAHDDFVTAIEIAVVVMQREDLNFEGAPPGHGAVQQIRGASAMAAWDAYDAAPVDRVTIGDVRVASALGIVDLERDLAGGDWRGYGERRAAKTVFSELEVWPD